MIDFSRRQAPLPLGRVLGPAIAIFLVLCVWAPGALGFGVTSFKARFTAEQAGAPAFQAGSHPYSAGARFEFESEDESKRESPGENPRALGDVKNIDVELPAGVIGDPTVTPTCEPQLVYNGGCPAATQIGTARVLAIGLQEEIPLYNITPPPNVPAEFGFKALEFVPVFITASVRPAEPDGTDGYGIDLHIDEISQAAAVLAAGIEFLGNPPASARSSFLRLPTSCGRGLDLFSVLDSWQGQSITAETSVTEGAGNPVIVSGCDRIPFTPRFSSDLETGTTDSPSGLTIRIANPQQTDPTGIATSDLRSTTVTLPPGLTIDPSAANGLGSCSVAQFDQFSEAASTCPDASKVGSVEIDTPILRDPLLGGVYLARQGENPFGSLIALYLIAEAHGVRVKLPGKVSADPSTGQLTADFQELPQLPFEELRLNLYGGSRAALATPVTCGSPATGASLVPWSGQPAAALSGSIAVGSGAGGSSCPPSPGSRPFNLGFEAGTVSPAAGLHSPFALKVSRPDGAQELGRIEASLPEGLLASIKGVPRCPAADAAAGTCGASSRVGSLSVGAGAGATPFYLDGGRAYLTGPYAGAPLGLDFVIPAAAGPIDLGNVVVRAGLFIDPVTTAVTVKSDPLPKILQGIPLRLRSIGVNVDRSGFIVNPTSCDPTQVAGQVTSTEGATANLGARFQATGCRGLAFAPKLSLRLRGGTKRNGNPALTAILTQAPGQADIGRASITLPRSEFLEQAHIRTVCTRVQFAAQACPKASVYGHVEAVTPLLDQPLRGPIYLRSSSHALPDLVAVLKGGAAEPIEIDLAGRVDSVRGALRTTFESVPDAPISKFVLRLQGGRKSLLVNSTDVCGSRQKATVKMTGQNGAFHDFRVPLSAASCRKAK